MSTPDITFVTYEDLPDLDPDDRLLLPELENRGIRADWAVWDDPTVDWSNAGLCVIRSTWDYHLKQDSFSKWISQVSAITELKNDAALLRWNLQKTYLRHLGAAGAAVVATEWIGSNDRTTLHQVVESRGWKQVIVKPVVGLATYGVLKVDCSNKTEMENAERHRLNLLKDGEVMVQPFLDSVTEYGERALIFINGEYSHAVSKTAFQALLPAGQAGEQSTIITKDELNTAQEAIDALPFSKPLYARVDLVRSEEGFPLVLELELVEPSLFLSFHAPAVKAFSDAIYGLLDN